MLPASLALLSPLLCSAHFCPKCSEQWDLVLDQKLPWDAELLPTTSNERRPLETGRKG